MLSNVSYPPSLIEAKWRQHLSFLLAATRRKPPRPQEDMDRSDKKNRRSTLIDKLQKAPQDTLLSFSHRAHTICICWRPLGELQRRSAKYDAVRLLLGCRAVPVVIFGFLTKCQTQQKYTKMFQNTPNATVKGYYC